MAEWGEFVASSSKYSIEHGKKILKVIEPYYEQQQKITYGFCPHCGCQVHRIWNLTNCGSCGGEISWKDLRIKGYGDVS